MDLEQTAIERLRMASDMSLRLYKVPNEVEVAIKAKPKPVTRPPQSWRYVEEELWND